MRRLIRLAGLFCVAAIQPALAADLPVYKAPSAPAVVAPAFSWTGIYIGGNVGYGWAKKDWTDPLGPPFDAGSHTATGWLGGLQAGANYQIGSWVIGVEGRYDWADLNGSHISLVDPADTLKTKVTSVASIAGRLGYAFDRFLVYGKGGGAWVRDEFTKIDLGLIEGQAAVTRSGWLVGAGIEYAVWNNLSVRLEYDYMDFGTQRVDLIDPAGGAPAPFDIRQRLQSLTFGVNYRFNPGL
jgi:outer membrane immunogenic protein